VGKASQIERHERYPWLSEVLGLKWTDVDWEGMRIAIRQAYAYGRQGEVNPHLSEMDAGVAAHADIRTTMDIHAQAVPAALREANSKVVRLMVPARVA